MADRKVAHFDVSEKNKELAADEEVVDHDPNFTGTKSTADDRYNMERMGKKQQLIVGS